MRYLTTNRRWVVVAGAPLALLLVLAAFVLTAQVDRNTSGGSRPLADAPAAATETATPPNAPALPSTPAQPSTSSTAPPTPSAPPPAPCLKVGAVSQPYFFDGPKEGPKAFGPAVPANLATAKQELRFRLCGRPGHGPDERLWAALDHVIFGSNPNELVPYDRWAQRVYVLVGSQLQWDQARIVSYDPNPLEETLAMDSRRQRPFVVPAEQTPGSSDFLVIPYQTDEVGYGTLVLRLACGFQPYFGLVAE